MLGLNVLVGYSGQISLGHGAFFAIGAYTAAILIDKHGWPDLLTLPAAGLWLRRRASWSGCPRCALRGLYLALRHARPGGRHAADDQALRPG